MNNINKNNPFCKKHIFLRTFGCQMNEYDSSRILDLLYKTYEITPTDNPKDADILIINTCSIREKAQEKVFSELGRWKKLKKQNPDLIIGITGCVASQEGKEIQKRAPYVDFVLGPQTIHRLPKVLEQIKKDRASVVDISFPEIEKFDHLPEQSVNGPCAYVTIMEGCNNFCSYCIVPYTRGKEISRPLEDILLDITKLSKKSVKEITLLGQSVNAYKGKDSNGNLINLATLLTHVSNIDGIERIRFMTSHPAEFTDDLILAFKNIPKLANHLHLPVQSGSDKILKLMKRRYTISEFKEKISKLREVRPDISISTDFIVGFPGETEKDFLDTLNLVTDADLDQSYSFIYSKRPGTEAAKFDDDVTLETKKDRLKKLQSAIKKQAKKINKKMIGTKQKVLVTERSKQDPDLYFGKTENNRVVQLRDCHIGDIVEVTSLTLT